ncbi:MAG: tetratricopeptide repeat protein [Flavobacteriaceae bacterium]|nr:tetratricopeptide repeat protein [Flavobacteriaceae bacterium]
MKSYLLPVVLFFLVSIHLCHSQTSHYQHYELKDFDKAKFLFDNAQYAAARSLFENVGRHAPTEAIAADAAYYIANCAVRLDKQNAGELLEAFVDKYPQSPRQKTAFLDAANYYFDNGQYSYALKWFNKTDENDVPAVQKETYFFKAGYANFTANNFKKADTYFKQLQQSDQYAQQAKYYIGYIAYQNDDYNQASSYFSQVQNSPEYQDKLSYFEADMNFKLGNFQKAIDLGIKALENARGIDRSELSKIVGESYFNLKNYAEAIPYLKNYQGKNKRYSNTDWYQLGYAYFMTDDYENAVAQFNKIIGDKNAVAQNAYYHLAQAYLKLNKKQEARNAFQSSANMNFDPKIQEAAALSHAKLSYEIGNLIQNVPEILSNFINRFPNNPEKREIEKLLVDSYISSKNYEAALGFMRKNKSGQNPAVFQKVLYIRAMELLTEQKTAEAYVLFNESLNQKADAPTTAKATYWKADVDYQQGRYAESAQGFSDFVKLPAATQTDLLASAHYNLGYALYQIKDYTSAISAFQNHVAHSGARSDLKGDAYLRMGDSHFALAQFWPALESYNQAIAMQIADADLAEFHKALSYGLLNRTESKRESLEKLIAQYPKSTLRDDTLYELGNLQLNTKQDLLAMQTYNQLIQHYSMSSFVPKALLKQGLIFFNNQQNEEAIKAYQRIAADFPNTPEAQQALSGARLAYVELGRGADYANWVKSLSFAEVSDIDIQNILFESANKKYAEGKTQNAIKDFEDYLKKYPSGFHSLRVQNLLGEYYFSQKDFAKALPYFMSLSESRHDYTEGALSRLSQIYLEKEQWTTVIPLLQKLESLAQTDENISFAEANLMRSFQNLNQTENAVAYAQKVTHNPKSDKLAVQDANLLLARHAFNTGDDENAKKRFEALRKDANGSIAAEALYVAAFYKNKEKEFEASNTIIQRLAKDYPGYKKYGVKGLLLMAQNFEALNDAFQATFILENVIQNFSDFPEEVEQAKTLLNAIKAKESSRNSSLENEKN